MANKIYLYAIYDTDIESYVSKSLNGYRANKGTWVSAGAAKNAALLMPTLRQLLPTNSKRFSDQNRFKIHKVELKFVEEV